MKAISASSRAALKKRSTSWIFLILYSCYSWCVMQRVQRSRWWLLMISTDLFRTSSSTRDSVFQPTSWEKTHHVHSKMLCGSANRTRKILRAVFFNLSHLQSSCKRLKKHLTNTIVYIRKTTSVTNHQIEWHNESRQRIVLSLTFPRHYQKLGNFILQWESIKACPHRPSGDMTSPKTIGFFRQRLLLTTFDINMETTTLMNATENRTII